MGYSTSSSSSPPSSPPPILTPCARILEAALVVLVLQVNRIWGDESEFSDIFDLEHFKKTLQSDVHFVSSLPSTHLVPKQSVENQMPFHVSPLWIRARFFHQLNEDGFLIRGRRSRRSRARWRGRGSSGCGGAGRRRNRGRGGGGGWLLTFCYKLLTFDMQAIDMCCMIMMPKLVSNKKIKIK